MYVNGEPIRVSHAFVNKNLVRYMRPHERFTYCIFTLAVRELPVWLLVSKYTIINS